MNASVKLYNILQQQYKVFLFNVTLLLISISLFACPDLSLLCVCVCVCEGLNIWFIELFTTLLSPRCLAHSKHYQCAPLDYNCVTGTRVHPTLTPPSTTHTTHITHTHDIVSPFSVPLSVLIIPELLYMSNGHSTWHARNQISCSFNEITQREIEKNSLNESLRYLW